MLRELTIALARDAKKGLLKTAERIPGALTVVHTRQPTMSDVDFEQIWILCRQSISKSCQTL